MRDFIKRQTNLFYSLFIFIFGLSERVAIKQHARVRQTIKLYATDKL